MCTFIISTTYVSKMFYYWNVKPFWGNNCQKGVSDPLVINKSGISSKWIKDIAKSSKSLSLWFQRSSNKKQFIQTGNNSLSINMWGWRDIFWDVLRSPTASMK